MDFNCQQAVAWLAEFIDQSASYTTKSAMIEHLGRCPACDTFVQTYERTSELCRRVLHKKAPEGLTQRVMEYVREFGN